MGVSKWLFDHWFTLLQSTGIIASLLFTGISLRSETRVRRISSLFTITQQHREIWTELYRKRELGRVLSRDVDLTRNPITLEEELFVTLLIFHLNTSYRAMREKVFLTPERLPADIQRFFSRPIPKAVWEKAKGMQNADFREFVDSYLGDDT